MIVSLKNFADEKKERLKKYLNNNRHKNICLAIVLATDDIACFKYAQNKIKLLDELNIKHKEFYLDSEVTQKKLNDLLDNLSKDDNITGIMLELPLFNNLDTYQAIDHIDHGKDVDGLTDFNIAKLCKGIDEEKFILPCTVKAIKDILDYLKIDLCGKSVVIIGRSILVGKPLQMYLTNRNATTTLCHSKTKDLKIIAERADILVVAVGKINFIDTTYKLKNNCVVIDVGTNYDYKTNKLYGDVSSAISTKNNILTPVPNGVGMFTKICMVENLIHLNNNENNKGVRDGRNRKK